MSLCKKLRKQLAAVLQHLVHAFAWARNLTVWVAVCVTAPPLAAATLDLGQLPPAASKPVDFARDIQPLFQARCYSCHGPEKQKGNLRLHRKSSALKGGDNHAPDILPGKSAESPLIQFVAGLIEDMVMPQKGERLSAAEIGLLRAWIDQGAPWPESESEGGDPRLKHWAFQPVVRPVPPRIADTRWGRNEIDGFVLARLERERLAPSAEADRRTLIRRVKFDLLGLPPTPEEVDAFIQDRDPKAYEKLVDRFLASPHYGERWARHWLDVVRFAESNGFETNLERPNAWPFRDYVIRAFNEDKPYDQFVREQLAGDAGGAEVATGFIVGGPWDKVKSPDPVLTAQQRADELNDMVIATGTSFLGLTVGCGRCHSHKFDPISQADYYRMAAVFAGVQHGEREIKSTDYEQRQQHAAELRKQLAPLERKLAAFDPLAHAGRTIVIQNGDAARTLQLVKAAGPAKYPAGGAPGQADYAGDARDLPNLGRGYLYWHNVAGKDVFAWQPKARGRFRVWVSWGCGYKTHAEDARYVLDRDANLSTQDDQMEIARVSHQKFANGAGNVPGQRQWSGFYDAGAHDFTPQSTLVLRGGADNAYVSADVVVLQESLEQLPSPPLRPHLRLPVTRGKNIERFTPVEARFMRFTILATTDAEPCLDELEVFTAEPRPRNVALACNGAKATASSVYPNNPFHKLDHLNDGRYGNSHSWISKERGQGWVQLEFARDERIDRVLWSRDRDNPPRFHDRVAANYKVEVSRDAQTWQWVASSADRLPYKTSIPGDAIYSAEGLPTGEAEQLVRYLKQRKELQAAITKATASPVAYAGRFVPPGATHRLNRGDPMQQREVVAPGALSEFTPKLDLAVDAPEQERRIALGKWITNPVNPLTARVMVNRIWQHHFGEGIVSTPSDFGLNGARPTHPQLLDWLASEFVARHWSVKAMHRLIVTSATYRQRSDGEPERRSGARDASQSSTTPLLHHPSPSAAAVDSSNRLLWRQNPRRLEAEPLRDTILAVCGNLDLKMGGPGFDLFEPNSNYVKVYESKTSFGPDTWRRMVYQTKPRMELDDTFGAFDCPDAGQITPKRNSSTTPLQALNLLNAPFILQQAKIFAGRLEKEAGTDGPAQIIRAFHLAFNRAPSDVETTAAVKLIDQQGLMIFCRALLNANEFIYVH